MDFRRTSKSSLNASETSDRSWKAPISRIQSTKNVDKKATKCTTQRKGVSLEESQLDAEVEVMKAERFEEFTELMVRMNQWLLWNKVAIHVLLKRRRHWNVNYAKFKAVLKDLKVPCNLFELHVMCRVLDRHNSGMISSKIFTSCSNPLLKYGLSLEAPDEEDLFGIPEFPEKTKQWELELEPLFTDVFFMYAPFGDIHTHPGHFNKVVSLDIFVHGLCDLIEKHVDLVTPVRIIFGMRFEEEQSTLPFDQTLREMKFEGGPLEFPTTVTLYYDIMQPFGPVFTCPLFLTTHYFLDNRKKLESVK